ncbi:MAG: PAS domain-containing protein, partial [Bacteroidota bacterium]
PKGEVIGKRPLYFASQKEGTHEEMKARADLLFKDLDNGKPAVSFWRIRNSKGETIPIEVRMQALQISNAPHYIGFIRDLSKQYHLDRRRALLESVIENSEEAFITIHLNKKTGRHYVSYVNPAFEKVTGYARDFLIQQTAGFWYKLFGEEEKTNAIRQIVRDREHYDTNLQIIRKSEEPLWINFSVTPVQTNDDDYVICRMKNIHTRVNRETMIDQFFRLGSDGFAIFDS